MNQSNYRDYRDSSYDFKILGMNHGLKLRFMADSYYFTCGYPCDLYESYRIGEKYQIGNFIVQGVGETLEEVSKKDDRFDKIFGCIENVSQREFDYNSWVGRKDMIRWFDQKGRWEDINYSNIFSIFYETIGMGIII
jgi:hypothetical protein